MLSHRGLLIQIIQEEYLNISPSGYFKIEPSNDDFYPALHLAGAAEHTINITTRRRLDNEFIR